MMSMSEEKTRTAVRSSNKSRTMARAMTISAHPPIACSVRRTISERTPVAKVHPAEEITNRVSPTYNGVCAVTVGGRPVEELAEGQAERYAVRVRVNLRNGRTELPGDIRKAGKIHVNRQRAQSGEPAQQDRQGKNEPPRQDRLRGGNQYNVIGICNGVRHRGDNRRRCGVCPEFREDAVFLRPGGTGTAQSTLCPGVTGELMSIALYAGAERTRAPGFCRRGVKYCFPQFWSHPPQGRCLPPSLRSNTLLS